MPKLLRRVACLAGIFLTLAPPAVSSQVPATAEGQAQGGGPGVAPGVVLGPPRDEVAFGIPGVVAPGEKVELVSAEVKGGDGIMGFHDGSALFIELGAGQVRRIAPDGRITTLAARAGMKAMGADREGNVIALLQDSFEIVHPPANVRMLAAGSDGLSLRTCNDFVVSSKGHIYASDVGMYNQPKYTQPTRIVFIPKGGKARVVADVAETMALPNGIVLSPDEKTLYISDSRNNSGMAWDVMPDGSIANPRAFAKYSISAAIERDFTLGANGIAIDSAGRLYVGMPFGVQVFNPKGTYLGMIPTTLKIQSVSFAGPKKEYLYMLAQRGVWRVRTIAHGHMPRAK
jgi:gluconolactonase